jgi:hypothetical protein
MGQTTSQIEAHIENMRDDLASNLHELERKVKGITDWKQHFQTKPWTMVGMAFGGGILLAKTFRGSKKKRVRTHRLSRPRLEQKTVGNIKPLENSDNTKGALIGVDAIGFRDFIGGGSLRVSKTVPACEREGKPLGVKAARRALAPIQFRFARHRRRISRQPPFPNLLLKGCGL